MRPCQGNLYQYSAPPTIPLSPGAFGDNCETAVYWLSAAGVMINTHGTVILVDPVLMTSPENDSVSETGSELMTRPPILATELPMVDAVCYTHADDDHMAPLTLQVLSKLGVTFHATAFTCQEMKKAGVPEAQCVVHNHNESFSIGDVDVFVTPADHVGQFPFRFEDCCGFRFTTRDGVVWVPGDTMLLGDHLRNKEIDLAFIDFGDQEWHLGIHNAIRLFNTLDQTDMIMYHHATFYAPGACWYNGDPNVVKDRLNDLDRLKLLAPGEKYVLHPRRQRGCNGV